MGKYRKRKDRVYVCFREGVPVCSFVALIGACEEMGFKYWTVRRRFLRGDLVYEGEGCSIVVVPFQGIVSRGRSL